MGLGYGILHSDDSPIARLKPWGAPLHALNPGPSMGRRHAVPPLVPLGGLACCEPRSGHDRRARTHPSFRPRTQPRLDQGRRHAIPPIYSDGRPVPVPPLSYGSGFHWMRRYSISPPSASRPMGTVAESFNASPWTSPLQVPRGNRGTVPCGIPPRDVGRPPRTSLAPLVPLKFYHVRRDLPAQYKTRSGVPHGKNRYPTPCTVCRCLGDSAESPSFRRRATITWSSARVVPKYRWPQTSRSRTSRDNTSPGRA